MLLLLLVVLLCRWILPPLFRSSYRQHCIFIILLSGLGFLSSLSIISPRGALCSIGDTSQQPSWELLSPLCAAGTTHYQLKLCDAHILSFLSSFIINGMLQIYYIWSAGVHFCISFTTLKIVGLNLIIPKNFGKSTPPGKNLETL